MYKNSFKARLLINIQQYQSKLKITLRKHFIKPKKQTFINYFSVNVKYIYILYIIKMFIFYYIFGLTEINTFLFLIIFFVVAFFYLVFIYLFCE